MNWAKDERGHNPPINRASLDDYLLDVIKRVLATPRPFAIVVDDDSNIRGTYYDRDYIVRLQHGSLAADDVSISEIMRESITFAQPDTRLTDAVWAMANHSYYLPIVKTSSASETIDEIKAAQDEDKPAGEIQTEPMPLSSLSSVISVADVVEFMLDQVDPDAVVVDATKPQPLVLDILLGKKNRTVLNTRIDDGISVVDAANAMAERGQSCIVVVDDNGRVQGVATGLDLLNKCMTVGKNAGKMLCTDVMTKGPVTVSAFHPVREVARAMIKRGIRHIPVTDADTQVIGVLTLADILLSYFPVKGTPKTWDFQRVFRLLPATSRSSA